MNNFVFECINAISSIMADFAIYKKSDWLKREHAISAGQRK